MTSSPDLACDVAILGAGLTGLAAARHLQAKQVDYRLFERDSQAGGLARTDFEAGYGFDRTGHLLHLSDPELERDTLALFDEPPRLLERRSQIFSSGVYTDYPFQANVRGLPPEVAYRCLLDFITASQRPATNTADFESYCRTHFGDAITEQFMLPYNERLLGVPLREITTDWCDRFVPRPKLEDVLAGAVGLPRPALGYNSRFYYPAGGIGELPRVLARGLRSLELNCSPNALDLKRRRLHFGGRVVEYEQLLSSLPLPSLLALAVELPDDLRQAGGQLRCTSLSYLDLALRSPPRQDWHWCYVPERRFPFYRVGAYSAFSSQMAPPGGGSVYVELADRDVTELNQVLPGVLRGLSELGYLEESQLEFARLRRLPFAYVIYDQQRRSNLDRVLAYLAEHGVISTGRYGGWNYSSMQDALVFGRQAADKVLAAAARSPLS